jgi:hypothetical protein
MTSQLIQALLEERRGYEMRGLRDRVKAVDEALRELGFDHKYSSTNEVEVAALEPEVEQATRSVRKKRKV